MKKFFLAPAVAALLFCVSCSSPASKLADINNTYAEELNDAKSAEDVKAATEKYTNALEELNKETKELSSSEQAEILEDKDVKASMEAVAKALEEAGKKYGM